MASLPVWSPDSWRSKPIKQQPKYADPSALQAAVDQVARLPPLVTAEEVDRLRGALAEVAEGHRFLLQGGDCAERFLDCAAEPVEKKLRILLQMSLVLTWGARIPTLRIARMAGQFAKPRSKDTEIIDGVEHPAFRGDNVNSFDTSSRAADPDRMVAGYFHSAATLNYARALLAGGLADLHSAVHWDLGFVQDSAHRKQYRDITDRILSALDFMRVCGVGNEAALKTADVFMSHEGLQLVYESALTRPVTLPGIPTNGMDIGSTSQPSSLPSSASATANVNKLSSPMHIAKISTNAVPSLPLDTPSTSMTTAVKGSQLPGTPVAPPAAHHHPQQTSHHTNQQQSTTPASGMNGSASGTISSASRSRGVSNDIVDVTNHVTAHAQLVPRRLPSRTVYYNLGTHFLWIGDRTRQLDHAHVEYFRGIANPVGIKVGPTTDPNELVALLRVLWPQPRRQRGKIVLITRLGAGRVRESLPPLIRAIHAANFGAPVVWTCDPMHGNTRVTTRGIKTRDFDDILTELRDTFEVHREEGSRLGGCHFELTGENVTECTGGPERLLEGDLPRRYTTYCDPRLNYAQGMELAFLIAQYLADIREEELARESGVPMTEFIASDGSHVVETASEHAHGGTAGGVDSNNAGGNRGGADGGEEKNTHDHHQSHHHHHHHHQQQQQQQQSTIFHSEASANSMSTNDGDNDTASISSLDDTGRPRVPKRALFAEGRGRDTSKNVTATSSAVTNGNAGNTTVASTQTESVKATNER